MANLAKVRHHTPARRTNWMENFWNSENIFDDGWLLNQSLPAVNVKDIDNHYEIELAAPGYKKDNFKAAIENGILTISAETSDEKKEDDECYTRREFSQSSFTRQFSLPDDIKEDSINAKYEDGLLKMSIEKSENYQPKRKDISIN